MSVIAPAQGGGMSHPHDSVEALCRKAGVAPSTFSRWKPSERNPQPIGAMLHSIGKLYDALDQVEKTSRRCRKVVA